MLLQQSFLLYSPVPWLLPASGTLQKRSHVQHQFTVNTYNHKHHNICQVQDLTIIPHWTCWTLCRRITCQISQFLQGRVRMSFMKQACRTTEKQQTLHNEGSIMALASFITIVTARWNQQIECLAAQCIYSSREGSWGRRAGTQPERAHRHVCLRPPL